MRLYDRLSSWQFSIVLTVSGALYYLLLAIWAAKSPPHVVRNIASLLPFLIFYVLLLLNTFLCIVRRWSTLVSHMRHRRVLLLQTPDWERSVDTLPASSKWIELEGGDLFVVRNRFAPLGTILLHGALFLLATGLLLTMLSRYEAKFYAAQGEKLNVQQDTFYRTSTPVPLTSGFPPMSFEAKDIRAVFWRDELLFTHLDADISIDGSVSRTAINAPIFLSPATSIRVSSFGYALAYMLVAGGAPLEESAVKLQIFPPGQRDFFTSQHFPHKFYVQFYPDWAEENGQNISRSMNLNHPRVVVSIYRQKVFLGEKILQFGESMDFEGVSLAFLQAIPMAEFTVTRDLGLPWILVSFVLILAGLVIRLPGKRGEMLARKGGDGWILQGKNVPEVKS